MKEIGKYNSAKFAENLKRINTAVSIRGRRYSNIRVVGKYIEFTREGKSTCEKININSLYNFYINEDILNTTNAKKYVNGRQSPAVAILIEIYK